MAYLFVENIFLNNHCTSYLFVCRDILNALLCLAFLEKGHQCLYLRSQICKEYFIYCTLHFMWYLEDTFILFRRHFECTIVFWILEDGVLVWRVSFVVIQHVEWKVYWTLTNAVQNRDKNYIHGQLWTDLSPWLKYTSYLQWRCEL